MNVSTPKKVGLGENCVGAGTPSPGVIIPFSLESRWEHRACLRHTCTVTWLQLKKLTARWQLEHVKSQH